MSGVAACSQSSRASKVTQMTNIPLLNSFDFRQATVTPTFKPKQLHRVNPLSVFNGGRYRIILPDQPIRIRTYRLRTRRDHGDFFSISVKFPSDSSQHWADTWVTYRLPTTENSRVDPREMHHRAIALTSLKTMKNAYPMPY